MRAGMAGACRHQHRQLGQIAPRFRTRACSATRRARSTPDGRPERHLVFRMARPAPASGPRCRGRPLSRFSPATTRTLRARLPPRPARAPASPWRSLSHRPPEGVRVGRPERSARRTGSTASGAASSSSSRTAGRRCRALQPGICERLLAASLIRSSVEDPSGSPEASAPRR